MTAKEQLAQERAELESALAERIVEGMDWNTLVVYVKETLTNIYSAMVYPDLLNEVREIAPDLLDEPEDNISVPSDSFTV